VLEYLKLFVKSVWSANKQETTSKKCYLKSMQKS